MTVSSFLWFSYGKLFQIEGLRNSCVITVQNNYFQLRTTLTSIAHLAADLFTNRKKVQVSTYFRWNNGSNHLTCKEKKKKKQVKGWLVNPVESSSRIISFPHHFLCTYFTPSSNRNDIIMNIPVVCYVIFIWKVITGSHTGCGSFEISFQSYNFVDSSNQTTSN